MTAIPTLPYGLKTLIPAFPQGGRSGSQPPALRDGKGGKLAENTNNWLSGLYTSITLSIND